MNEKDTRMIEKIKFNSNFLGRKLLTKLNEGITRKVRKNEKASVWNERDPSGKYALMSKAD